MAKIRHLFICEDGVPLPGWLALTPGLTCIRVSAAGIKPTIRPDLIWVRFGADQKDTGSLLSSVRFTFGAVPCVVLADLPNDEQALAAFSDGARGYCNSHAGTSVLKLITEVVLQGGMWVGSSLLNRLVSGVSASIAAASLSKDALELEKLSRREREVAQAIANGASNKEIARLLSISDRTVKAHVTTIFNKLQVKDRLQLALKIKGL